MATLDKRTTIYLEKDIHKLLKLKSFELSMSMSELIDIALRKVVHRKEVYRKK